MLRKTPFAIGETYHIYNRGAHKQPIFLDQSDYERFLMLLHLANNTGILNMRELRTKYKERFFVNVFEHEVPDKKLVEVLAYCLLPNHFHIVLREKSEGGITAFMRKLCVGYSMYFNTRHGHSGVIFQGPFKSSHIGDEAYFRYIFAYVHLNSLALVEPKWEEEGIHDTKRVRRFFKDYRYSSFQDFSGAARIERKILAHEEVPDFLKEQNDLEDLLSDFTKFTKNGSL